MALLFLPLLFFVKPLVLGEISTPTDNLFSYLPWAPFAPPGYPGPSNYLLFDQVFNFSPWHQYASDSIHHGRFPLWNPYGACGVPFFANLSSAVLFPLNLLLYLIVPFPWLLTWIKIGKLVLAGVFMRAFLRELGAGAWPALLGAISFAYSGFMIVWLGHAHTNVALCLPLVFLAVEKILRQPDKMMKGTALLAVAVGIQFLGGHIETSVHLLLGAACYLALRLVWEERQPVETLYNSRAFRCILLDKAVHGILPPVGSRVEL